MTNRLPKPFVIVATRGRARETAHLLDYLAAQDLPPHYTLVVGADANDIDGLAAHPLVTEGRASILTAAAPGLTKQRNAGLAALTPQVEALSAGDWFVVFFDDDFRPAHDWLRHAAMRFAASPDVVGLCGSVLADGITCAGYDEVTARNFLLGKRPPEPHWSQHAHLTDLPDGLYGCNMAYRGTVAFGQRFDERLPLYGWQEDIDFGGRARAFGRLVGEPACRGVHMGVQGGRTSGLRFGYSQIANPLYLVRKGSMRTAFGARLMCRNLASNLFNSARLNRRKDYFGRLRGNLHALVDVTRGRLAPERILSL